MLFHEIGTKLLTCRGFTAVECDHARRVVSKWMMAETTVVRQKFLDAGGNEAEWDYITDCLRGASYAHWAVKAQLDGEFVGAFQTFLRDPQWATHLDELGKQIRAIRGE